VDHPCARRFGLRVTDPHGGEVMRLKTPGGVAPAGTCDPQATPIVNVPYQADYVFING